MADSGSALRGSLLQLQACSSAEDRCNSSLAGFQLIRSLGQECVLCSDSALLGG